jgi:hypothetical protein
MASADAQKVEEALKKITTVITQLAQKLESLERRMLAVEKSQERPSTS